MSVWQQFPQEPFLSGVMGGRRKQGRLRPCYSAEGSEVCELR